MYKINSFLLVCCCFLLVACAPTHKRIEGSSQQINQEARQQLKLAAQIRASRKARVRKITSRLNKATLGVCSKLSDGKKTRCTVPVKVIENTEINAYADGKTAYITKGIIDFTSNDEELAAIIGHEMAHNILMHMDKKQANGFIGELIGVGVQVATGVDARALFRDLGRLTYSQSFESEADYVGLYLVARAGYDYTKSPNAWRKMGINAPNSIKAGLLSTHPGTSERYIALDAAVLEIQSKQTYGLPILPDKTGKDEVAAHVAMNGDIALPMTEQITYKREPVNGYTYTPPSKKTNYGKWGIAAENTALAHGCTNKYGQRTGSTLTFSQYATEKFTVKCSDGRTLVIACEYGKCKVIENADGKFS